MNGNKDNFYLNDNEKFDALNDDEQKLDNNFLFNEKNFSTIVVEQKVNDNSVKQILDVSKFIRQYQSHSEKNDLLKWLKDNNLSHLLTEQIKQNHPDEIKTKLICTYWESGFSNPNDLLVFIPHLLSSNFDLSLEAHTSILALDKPFAVKDIQQALQMIENKRRELSVEVNIMIDEIVQMLQSQLSETEK